MLNSKHRAAAELLWNYHRLARPVSAADGILVFGSNDLRVAHHAISLLERGLGGWILFSGGRGRMTQDWPQTEAATMAALARSRGVPDDRLWVEDQSTHTGDNIRLSRELLAAAGVVAERFIVVHKPYMERRTQAALDVQWPGCEFLVTSPPLDFEGYCAGELSPRLIVEAMVGDLQRIIEYPSRGYASVQAVPAHVLTAFQFLRDEGFTGQLC